ncbi:MAG: Uracil-DNA glycosylase, partial [Candidatus Collierbacteria bacterium GW2011_GWF2_44_15]
RWADQGVLLLNATLTVRAHQAGSHQNKGWEQFTDAVIKVLSDKKVGLVFLLWGNYAQKKGVVIDGKKHLVLKAPHPSPLSAHSGFFGSKHFSQANTRLNGRYKKSPVVETGRERMRGVTPNPAIARTRARAGNPGSSACASILSVEVEMSIQKIRR